MEIKIDVTCRCCGQTLVAHGYSKEEQNVGYIGYSINTPVVGLSVEPCDKCLAGLENFIRISKEIENLRAKVKPWNK